MDATHMFDLISASLFQHEESLYADQELFDELKKQAILALSAPVFSSLDISGELRKEWKTAILELVLFNERYYYVQSSLPITVPYVILKGTSAAQYYPWPEFRKMGDIDIITRKEDFDQALHQLVCNGFHIVQDDHIREIVLEKEGIVTELHRSFASLNNPAYSKYLDDLIFENITSSHVLPDEINGLTLLEHISQHLEHGLGLRQIIDWMMFVDRCLPDEKWPEFKLKTDQIGLTKLAIVSTRMCEKYLGLPQRNWCFEADNILCEQLMEYVMSCGNFGSKRISESDISEDVLAYATNYRMAFRLLKKQGLVNWKAARRHKLLRPFAWIYQAFRYVSRGLRRKEAFSKLYSEHAAAKKRNAMFIALGVKMREKGIYILQDGKYVKL